MKKFIVSILSGLILLGGCTPKEVKLAEKISKSTVLVHIKVQVENKQGMGTCSGVVVSEDEILLANHCVSMPEGVKLKQIWVKDYDGRSQKATVGMRFPEFDLAVLNVKINETPAKLADSAQVGETCYVVGHPLGIAWVVSKGIVSRNYLVDSSFKDASFFVTDAVVLPGNSGGGVWNEKGELLGIVSMSTSMMGSYGAAGLGIIIDISSVKRVLFFS